MHRLNALATITILFMTASSCTKNASKQAGTQAPARYQVLSTAVPETFDHAAFWKKEGVCPDKATLLPLVKLQAEPGDLAFEQGFQFYYGRRCAIIKFKEGTIVSRGLASVDDHDSVSLVPHGPFIWWYENGRVMAEGYFQEGVISGEWKEYTARGAIIDNP